MSTTRFADRMVTPAERVPSTFSSNTGVIERRCAVGTPLRRPRKEFTCRQEP